MTNREKWIFANVIKKTPLNILKISQWFYLIIIKIKWERDNFIKKKNIKLNY
jgi:hypothetical protein